MISIEYPKKRHLLVKAVDPNREAHRDKLLELSSREAIYDDDDNFLGWQLPTTAIFELLHMFRREDIKACKDIDKLIEAHLDSLKAPEDLPLETRTVARADKNELRDYQDFYVRINRTKTRLLCTFDVGLGKTCSSLLRAAQLGFNKLIVLAPKAVLSNWRAEVKINLDENTLIYHGEFTPKERQKLREEIPKARIIACNYEMAHEIYNYCKDNKIKFDQIVVDEAHIISRQATDKTKAVKSILQYNKAAGVQFLSGTPVLKDLRDLYELVNLLAPEIAGSRRQWHNDFIHYLAKKKMTKTVGKPGYEKVIEFEKKIMPVNKNVDECYKRIRPILVKVDRKSDFKDDFEIVTCAKTPLQQKLYGELSTKLIAEWNNGTISISNILTRTLRMLQVSEGVFNLQDELGELLLDSGKLEYICHTLNNCLDKYIVWSRFKPITYILHDLYKSNSVIFNGDLSQNEHELAVMAFNGTDDLDRWEYCKAHSKRNTHIAKPGAATRFFGTSDLRASIGNNLHRECFRQIHSSFNYNHLVDYQSDGRLRRVGQSAEYVYTTYLVTESTIEREVLEDAMVRHFSNMQVIGYRRPKISQAQAIMNAVLRNQ